MGKKNYLVTMRASCVVFVEGAKDDEEAYNLAHELAFAGDFEVWESEAELVTGNQEDVESAKYHADLVSEAP